MWKQASSSPDWLVSFWAVSEKEGVPQCGDSSLAVSKPDTVMKQKIRKSADHRRRSQKVEEPTELALVASSGYDTELMKARIEERLARGRATPVADCRDGGL